MAYSSVLVISKCIVFSNMCSLYVVNCVNIYYHILLVQFLHDTFCLSTRIVIIFVFTNVFKFHSPLLGLHLEL